MGLFDDATNAVSTPIVPQGNFVVECIKLEEAPPYAPPGESPKPDARPGIRWILALYNAQSGARFTFQDEPYEFFQTTTSNMSRGAAEPGDAARPEVPGHGHPRVVEG
jgi:hypothetical protein